ncbi:PAS domain S-box protein [Pantanalinema rosaneae CENA516]|uniref:PAS domain-containing sensor histidine kinase n=1 Tax=Pantanalinema rosaneae TaxID=1620701 RepID=UPI003D6F2D0E
MSNLLPAASQTIEHAAIGICHVSLDGYCLLVNQRLCDIVGYNREELSAFPLQQITDANDRDSDRDLIHQLLKGDIPCYSVEKRYIHKSGSTIWVSLDVSLVCHPSGAPAYFITMIQDISERKRVEEERQQAEVALKQSEERFRSLMQACAQIIWNTNPVGELVTEQPTWSEFTGQTFEQYRGWGWLSVIHPEDSAHVASVWSSAVATRSRYEVEFRLRRHDGEYRYMSCRAVPIVQPDGTIREWIGANTDITERRQTELALQQKEERYRTLITAIPQIVWTTDAEGRVSDMVDWRAFTGQTEAEVKGFNWLNAIHPDDRDHTADIWFKAIQTKTLYDTEYRLRAADGSYRYFVVRGLPILGEDGNIIEWVGTCTDIHNQKQTEQTLRQTLEILDLASDCIIIRDMDDRVLYWNQGAENLYGWQREEVLGHYIHTLLNTTFPDSLEACIAQFLQQGFWEGELQHTARDGRQVMVASRWTLQRDATGKPFAQLEINNDITQQKAAEVALRQSEERLQAILDNSPAMFYMKDLAGRLVLINRQLETVLGLSREEILGKRSDDLFPQDIADAHNVNDRAVLEARTAMQWEEHAMQQDQVRTYLSLKFPLLAADGSPYAVCGISTDITERKQAEMALAQAKEAAEAASRAKSEFLANMSHELRTPLNGIMGYAQILQRSKRLDEEDRSRIDVIYQCASHLLTLINDILDLSKIEAQKVELMLTDFHFPAFLQGVAEMCRIRAELKEIEFHYQLPSELPIGVRTDEKRLRQVLINLLSNAIKFTDAGSVTFTVSYASEQKLRFEVRDTGIGIPQDLLEKIFQPFEQVGDVKRQTEGTGLGLAISQKIVNLMDSTIQVQSEVGVGSVFWFDVKLQLAEEWVKAAQTDRHGQIIGIKDQHPKILVVDDKWANRSVINNLLSPLGFQVFEAVDGQDGWEQALKVQPDLVITDLLMPKLDGFELIKQIRESSLSDTRIIVSSASVFEADQHRSIEAGGDAFLPKPIQAIELLQQLQKQLKLEWIYEAQAPSVALESNVNELIAPPAAALETLYELAMKGNFKGIIKQAAYLETLDIKYRPFAQALNQLAREFQDDKILVLIQSYK